MWRIFVVLILFSLLFRETAEQAAYSKLMSSLNELGDALKNLQREMPDSVQHDTSAGIVARIESIRNSVNKALGDMNAKSEKEIRKDISIDEPVTQATAPIEGLIISGNFSVTELIKLLDNVEQIWTDKIQTSVEDARK